MVAVAIEPTRASQQSGPYHNKKAHSRPFPMPLLSRQREMPKP
jgi:hypothetical protein